MEAVWAAVRRGSRHVVFLGGEPGAGKTRLAAEIAQALHPHDVAVLVGSCSRDAGVPYRPFAEMLDRLFSSAAVGTLTDLVADDSASELMRLSAHVARHRPEGQRPAERMTEDRGELFDAVSDFLRLLSADRPIALIVDDLHWAKPPTLALFEHVARSCTDIPMLVLATFRTTVPDRSEDILQRVADLHRLEGVRRLDLEGLDTDAITTFLHLRSRVSLDTARASAPLLRDRTGGNPFFLRELWGDLERRGGVDALRSSDRVPATIGDTLQQRLRGLTTQARSVLETAAILGDSFDLATVTAAADADGVVTTAALDEAEAVGLLEVVEPESGTYAFVHSLVRQAVIEALGATRRVLLHARAAQALALRGTDPALVPRIASHYLAAQVLGYTPQALEAAREAARLAEHSLAHEDAAMWFERAAGLPQSDPSPRAELLLAAGGNHMRAGDSARARDIFRELTGSADPVVRLAAATGFENATWRPGLADPRASELLTAAIADSGLGEDDPRYVRATSSLARALVFAGDPERADQVGTASLEAARRLGDEETVLAALEANLWLNTGPERAEEQIARGTEVCRFAKRLRDPERLCSGSYFRASAAYTLGLPDVLDDAMGDAQRAEAGSQPLFSYVAGCMLQGRAFAHGDFVSAERRAERLLELGDRFGGDRTEGPYGMQKFMINRETGGLEQVRAHITGHETFDGQWVPGLLALYTELGIEAGIERALRHLMSRDLDARVHGAQWPMELAFMVEAALALGDRTAARSLRRLLSPWAGKNLLAGEFSALFGSADRYLARIAALLGEDAAAEAHFTVATRMDERMGSTVHLAETVAHHALFAASHGQDARAATLAGVAREHAASIGQQRVLTLMASLEAPGHPDALSDREMAVLRLLAQGLSNREIGRRLYISGNTAANHVRSILDKTGAANRTQAAVYAVDRGLV